VGLNSQLITRFDCHAAVCLSDEGKESLRNQDATNKAWISLEQNIIDTVVNEWRKRLLACVHIVGQHFNQFYCRHLKKGQLDEMSAKMSEM